LLLAALIWLLTAVSGMAQAIAADDRPVAVSAASGVTIILRGNESPAAIQRVLDGAQKSGKPVTVRIDETPPAVGGAAAEGVVAETARAFFMQSLVAGIRTAQRGLAETTALSDAIRTAAAAMTNAPDGPAAFGLLALVLAIGLAAGFICWLLMRSWSNVAVPADATLLPRTAAATRRAVADVMILLVYLLGAGLAADVLIPDQDILHHAVHTLFLRAIFDAGVHLIVTRFLLWPLNDGRPLLPMARARRHMTVIGTYAIYLALLVGSAAFLATINSDRAAIAGWTALHGTIVTLMKIWWFWDARADIADLVREGQTAEALPLWRRVLANTLPALFILSAILIWVIGRILSASGAGVGAGVNVAITQVVIVLAPLAIFGLARVAREWAAQPTNDPWGKARRALAESGTAAIVAIAIIAYLARAWSNVVLDQAAPDISLILQKIATVGVVVIGGLVFWNVARTFIDAFVPKPRIAQPGEDDVPEGLVQSRLSTVLPVMRGVVLGAIIAVTVLLVLSRLNVDIAPLLAGFGILGLAFSFGSQALVRDIVSGIFFLAEDAFRVGEYIDTGKLKGTVEKITLRSVQLRHQSGQVHVVPYGQISSVSNASRDWATVRFNIRLDQNSDLETVRKTIKRTGLAMMEDPEIGDQFILPLKLQGLVDIADGAMVVRLKFTAKPINTSLLQREGLKRVYKALTEAGIHFFAPAVTVRGGQGSLASDAAAATRVLHPATAAAS
jgi:small-conductance mechanosensitive channel